MVFKINQELSQFASSEEYKPQLTEVVGLLAYKFPQKSPLAHLLDQSRRETLANELNSFLLGFESMSPTSGLERIIRHLTVLHCNLEDKEKKGKRGSVPGTPLVSSWDLEQFLGDNCI